MVAGTASTRVGGDVEQLGELRRVLGHRHWDVAGEARAVGRAIDTFQWATSEHLPHLPPHALRGLELADRIDAVARRVEETAVTLAAADRWLGRTGRRIVDAETGRQAAVGAWRTLPAVLHWQGHGVRPTGTSPWMHRALDRADAAATGVRWDGYAEDVTADLAKAVRDRGSGAASRFGATVGDDAGRIAQTWGRLSNSRIGAVGRLGGRAVGVGGIVVGVADTAHGIHEGDTEQVVTGGLATVASAAMFIPCPPVQAAAAVVTVGLLAYEYRDELTAAGRAVADAAWDAVGGLF